MALTEEGNQTRQLLTVEGRTTASEFKTSGTGRMHRVYRASVGECQKVIGLTTSLRDQFMAMGMNEDQAQKLAEQYKNTHDAAGRFFLVADGADQ